MEIFCSRGSIWRRIGSGGGLGDSMNGGSKV